MDANLRKGDFSQVVPATQVHPKCCGLFVLATLAILVGLASMLCLATLSRLTRVGKVARLEKPQLFRGTLVAAATCEKTLFLRLALSVDSHKN